MKKVKKKENGAVIVEATLVLPMFIFLVFTLMWIGNLCTAQAKIQVAINSAAKEISTYTYLYGLTGLNEKQAGLKAEGDVATGTIEEGLDGVNQIYGAISSATSGASYTESDLNKTYSEVNAGKESIQKAYEEIKADPKAFFLSLGKASANVGINKAKSMIMAPAAKYLCEKHLKTKTLSADAYLKKLGVVGGYDGVDFSSSQFCSSGDQNITIVAMYKLKTIQFFKIDVTYNIVQSATTNGWFGVSSKGNSEKSDNN